MLRPSILLGTLDIKYCGTKILPNWNAYIKCVLLLGKLLPFNTAKKGWCTLFWASLLFCTGIWRHGVLYYCVWDCMYDVTIIVPDYWDPDLKIPGHRILTESLIGIPALGWHAVEPCWTWLVQKRFAVGLCGTLWSLSRDSWLKTVNAQRTASSVPKREARNRRNHGRDAAGNL